MLYNIIDRDCLPRKSHKYSDSNFRKSFTSLNNSNSEPTERNHTETGVGKYSGSRSRKSNLPLLQNANQDKD